MKNQKGLSLYLAVIIMVILLAVVLGVGTILVGQLKTIKGIENSVIAFYAADTGMEKVLMDRNDPIAAYPSGFFSGTLEENGATYEVTIVISGGACTANNFCIKSVGTYRGTKRAIQVGY